MFLLLFVLHLLVLHLLVFHFLDLKLVVLAVLAVLAVLVVLAVLAVLVVLGPFLDIPDPHIAASTYLGHRFLILAPNNK